MTERKYPGIEVAFPKAKDGTANWDNRNERRIGSFDLIKIYSSLLDKRFIMRVRWIMKTMAENLNINIETKHRIQCGIKTAWNRQNTSRRFNLRAFVRAFFILTLLTKALWSKRREVFLFIFGSCYTTLDAKLFEDTATLLPGYIETKHAY